MKRLAIAAVGLALVVGIVVGAMVGNPFDGKASAAPPKPTPTPQPVVEQNLDANGNIKVHEQGVVDVNVVSMPPSGGACYTNWNSADCAAGWTAVSVGEWTAIAMAAVSNAGGNYPAGWGGTTLICAAPKTNEVANDILFYSDTSMWGSTADNVNLVDHEPCAICCR